MGLNKKRNTLSKGGSALKISSLSKKRRSVSRKNKKTQKEVIKLGTVTPTSNMKSVEEGTVTPTGNLEGNQERTITREKDNFHDIGSYNFLMKIKKGEAIVLDDFNFSEFNSMKIYILSETEYNNMSDEVLSSYLNNDFEKFYNNIGYSISIQENKTLNTRGQKKITRV